jgi:hypothetical protein
MLLPDIDEFTLASSLERMAEHAAQPGGVMALASAAVAGVLIVVSCFVRTILPLRVLAVGSNIGFMLYGLLAPSPMTFLLHTTLLPLNLFRAWQMFKLTRNVKQAAAVGERVDDWLTPYMKPRKLRAGATLFQKGDEADKLYYLVGGRMELVEFGSELEVGRLFGEIAFFAPDRRRTATARCITPCTVLMLTESTFKQLYFQNPDFGFEVVRLIAGRLSEDVRRLQQRV